MKIFKCFTFIFSLLISQETKFELLPLLKGNIPQILVDQNQRHRFTLNDNFIYNSKVNLYDDNYKLYELKYVLKNKDKYRIILKIDLFPTKGKLFISDSKNQFEGPLLLNHVNINNQYISGIINDNEITVKYLHPIDQPLPQIICDYIISEKNYSIKYQNDKNNYNYTKQSNRENPIILVTGYWPPTNEMVRHFSQNLSLNPSGWEGQNWENSGYDIVSFFPEFDPPDCNNCGIGYGDLEVDYQNTSEDFWPIVNNIKPLGIITFSRGFNNMSWELEMNTYNRANWINDYLLPYLPIPNPPDEQNPINYHRETALPVLQIRDAINSLNIGLDAYIDYEGHAGAFLSEFMGFHGIWYKDLHQYNDIDPCFSAGHIHVGSQVPIDIAKQGAEESIRVLINYLNQFIYTLGDLNSDELVDILDIILIVNSILGTINLSPLQFLAADLNENGLINVLDIIQLVNLILES